MINHWENYSLDNIQEEIDGILYTEEWSPISIKEFKNAYEISSFGRIKRIETNTINKQTLVKEGYLRLRLSNHGYTKNIFAHIAVAKTFIPNPNNFKIINHKSGIKTDNMVCKIEWTTQQWNIIHAFRTGLSKTGENHGKSKLTNTQALEIYNQPKEKRKILSERYKISESTIKKIRNGTSWNYVTLHLNKFAI